jgi:regulator of sirC expression with transglutaminase-like and TPR domain
MMVPEDIRADFVQMVNRPDEALELARIALLVAAESDLEVDIDGELRQLEGWAEELRSRLGPDLNNLQKLARLRSFVFDDLGFRGDRRDYYSPSNSLLHQVMKRRPWHSAHALDRVHGAGLADRHPVRRRRVPRPLPGAAAGRAA